MIMDHFVVEGVSPLNKADVQRIFDERDARLMEAINHAVSVTTTPTMQISESMPTAAYHQDIQGFITWCRGGKFGRYCPQEFKFPTSDVKTHYGTSAKKIAPYKNLSRANSVMAAIESYAHSRESFTRAGDVSKMPRNVSDYLFNEWFNDFIVNLFGARNIFRIWPPETTYATRYNRLQKKRKLDA